jgi:hypothetical protein
MVWVHIFAANKRYQPWEYDSIEASETSRYFLRIIARSPTIFPSKNHDLRSAIKALNLEWLTPSEIGRIRECPAPRRKIPRHRFDRQFGYGGIDPESPSKSPKCKRLFWAWRSDQKTCDSHQWAASMLRVEKYRKAESDRIGNARQLKGARQQLKRVRRATKKAQRLALANQPPPVTPSKLQAQNDLADFRLLQSVWLDMIETSADADDPERLKEMIKSGYVLPPDAESETHRLSREGLLQLKELRGRTSKPPIVRRPTH